MSEGAASAVGMIASVRTGQIKLSYSKDDDSGRYWTSYNSTTCAKPNVDAAKGERWRESQKREIEQELMALRSAADSDQSGFVSTEEGSEFRRIVEFGFLAAYIAQAGNADLAAIATGTGLDMDTTREQIRKYRDFDRALVAAGSPRLPGIIVE